MSLEIFSCARGLREDCIPLRFFFPGDLLGERVAVGFCIQGLFFFLLFFLYGLLDHGDR